MIACASKNSKSWAHQVSISMVIVNRKHMFVVCSFLIHENKAKKIFHKETVKKNHRCPKTANTLNTSFYSFLRLSIPVRLSPLAFSIRKIYQGAPWPKKYRWFVSITRIFSTSSLLPQHAPMLRMEQQFTDAFYSLLSPLRGTLSDHGSRWYLFLQNVFKEIMILFKS